MLNSPTEALLGELEPKYEINTVFRKVGKHLPVQGAHGLTSHNTEFLCRLDSRRRHYDPLKLRLYHSTPPDIPLDLNIRDEKLHWVLQVMQCKR
jgi:hypothetical protein